MTKKFLLALGISMMSTLPLTQAATNEDHQMSEIKPAFSMNHLDVNTSNRNDKNYNNDNDRKRPIGFTTNEKVKVLKK